MRIVYGTNIYYDPRYESRVFLNLCNNTTIIVMDRVRFKFANKYTTLVILFFTGLIISGINPRNPSHWVGETLPAIVGFVILASTFRKFRFSLFTYIAILFASYLLFVGGHYTFSRVPFFNWIAEITSSGRNDFDKFGHFIQGVVPVLISRELFIRRKLVKGKSLISFIAFCIAMATTSVYELIEYVACILGNKNPVTFLGTQGSFWDSQTDMLFAAAGALFIIFFLSKLHNKAMEREFPGSTF